VHRVVIKIQEGGIEPYILLEHVSHGLKGEGAGEGGRAIGAVNAISCPLIRVAESNRVYALLKIVKMMKGGEHWDGGKWGARGFKPRVEGLISLFFTV